MSTGNRIAKRKADRDARRARQAKAQAQANARHARQRSRGDRPYAPAFDEWLDSPHDYEAFGQPRYAKRDENGVIEHDIWPAGFRGQLGVAHSGRDAGEINAERERKFKQQQRWSDQAYRFDVERKIDGLPMAQTKEAGELLPIDLKTGERYGTSKDGTVWCRNALTNIEFSRDHGKTWTKE